MVALKLVVCTLGFLMLLGPILAGWLWATNFRGKFLVEFLLAIPLVLPLLVVILFFWIAMEQKKVLGITLGTPPRKAIFLDFSGMVLGTVLFLLPMVVRSFLAAFQSVQKQWVEASWCLGVSRLDTFFRVVLPLSGLGIFTAIVLTVALTLGTWGLIYTLAENISGLKPNLAPVLYDSADEYTSGNWLLLVVFGLVGVVFSFFLNLRLVRT